MSVFCGVEIALICHVIFLFVGKKLILQIVNGNLYNSLDICRNEKDTD